MIKNKLKHHAVTWIGVRENFEVEWEISSYYKQELQECWIERKRYDLDISKESTNLI